MIWRTRTRARIKVAAGAFACLGLVLWVIAATLHVTPPSARDVDLGHTGDRSLGVVAGGVFIVGGIALLVPPAEPAGLSGGARITRARSPVCRRRCN